MTSVAATTTPADSLIDPENLPGPKGYPIVGVAPKLDREGFHSQLENWYREFGGRYTFKLGKKHFVVFGDADACKDVLRRRPTEFRRGKHLAEIIDELGAKGVFSAEGDRWKKQRKLMMPGFNQAQLRHFFPQILTVAERLHGMWTKRSRHLSGDTAWDFSGDFERFTTDVTTNVAFGHDVNSVEGGRNLLQSDIEQVFPEIQVRLNSVFPIWRYFKRPRDKRIEAALDRLNTKLLPIVESARQKVMNHPDGPDPDRAETLLEAMIVAGALDEEGQSFTEEEILGNVMTVLLAGEDTTAHTMSWIAHALVSVPGAQDKLREELDRVLGDAPGLTDLQQARQLPYLNGVIQEALRLRSVAPLMFYQCYESTSIDNIRVQPEHVCVLLTRFATCQDEHFSASQEFIPERWMRDEEANASRCPVHNARAMLPFGNGPRTCPGRSLSLLEMNVALARLIKNFVIEPVGDPSAVREVFAFTMHPTGFELRLRAR